MTVFIQGQDKISFQISELLYNVCVMFSWIASEGRFWFKLSKVPVWEIVNTTFVFFYKLHVHSSYIWASLGDGSQTFVAFILLMTDLCCTRMFDTVCFVLTGRYPLLHITKSMYRGAAHTSTQQQWQNCVPQRFPLPHFSLYQAVRSSLCMELLWLLVRSSWSQRQKSSPKCECEHALSMKYLTTNCFIRILRRIFINFQLERRVLAALCTSMACSFGKCVFGDT